MRRASKTCKAQGSSGSTNNSWIGKLHLQHHQPPLGKLQQLASALQDPLIDPPGADAKVPQSPGSGEQQDCPIAG